MIRLALLRHGHTSWNRAGRIQGRTDIPLDPEAADVLRSLALPRPWDTCALASSPLARAAETARLVSGREPEKVPALMEMDWGDWEGLHAADLHAAEDADHRPIETWGWNYTPPNGEAPAALRERLKPWAENLSEDTLAVCHIGVMRAALALATGWQFEGPAPFRIKRNRLYVIRIADGEWYLEPDTIPLVERSM
ncbi:Phosphoglycerate mutase family protein [Sulfitobacter noctilucicola]|uniref:Putative phosphoglycerate mutase n=1 Tax=Sulfitobacter noctilucicola TaxID=1342301 RepID=A0A7W6M9R1_9RHOB|nr:histidine phosphatase family protein [Sulfitobacter noctilucicola]KIN63424.1 Phosphoglycerate mutase family protein [Sulfitobacter noctilucicola]MBB4175063.1 putative phosphoglycerate mutase [Sulfitobacter noctilucicola]